MVGWGRLKYPSYAHAWAEDVCVRWTNDSFILGLVALGEAAEAMVELCLWAIYYSSVPQLFVFFATPRVPQLFVLGNVLIFLRIPTIKYISAKSRPPCSLARPLIRVRSILQSPVQLRKGGKSGYFPQYCSYRCAKKGKIDIFPSILFLP